MNIIVICAQNLNNIRGATRAYNMYKSFRKRGAKVYYFDSWRPSLSFSFFNIFMHIKLIHRLLFLSNETYVFLENIQEPYLLRLISKFNKQTRAFQAITTFDQTVAPEKGDLWSFGEIENPDNYYTSKAGKLFKITGIDTFERVDLERVVSSIRKSSFIDSNVKYIKCDSQDITTSRLDDIGMHNIIIDDAEHTPDANRTTLENFWGNLYEDGIYVIEDVWPLDDMSYEELGHFWLEKYKEEFTEEKFKDFIQTVECFDIEYSRRDLRNPHPDSYMFILQR